MIRWAGGMHWSGSSRAWFGACAALDNGRFLVRHELTWLNKSPAVAATDILKLCERAQIDLAYVSANPSIFPKPKAQGETVSDQFSAAGINLLPGDDDRANGWSMIRSLLDPVFVEEGDRVVRRAKLAIHRDCAYLLRTLPTLVENPNDKDDVHESPDEIPANGLRYYVMSRPSPLPADEMEYPADTYGSLVQKLRDQASLRV